MWSVTRTHSTWRDVNLMIWAIRKDWAYKTVGLFLEGFKAFLSLKKQLQNLTVSNMLGANNRIFLTANFVKEMEGLRNLCEKDLSSCIFEVPAKLGYISTDGLFLYVL